MASKTPFSDKHRLVFVSFRGMVDFQRDGWVDGMNTCVANVYRSTMCVYIYMRTHRFNIS